MSSLAGQAVVILSPRGPVNSRASGLPSVEVISAAYQVVNLGDEWLLTSALKLSIRCPEFNSGVVRCPTESLGRDIDGLA